MPDIRATVQYLADTVNTLKKVSREICCLTAQNLREDDQTQSELSSIANKLDTLNESVNNIEITADQLNIDTDQLNLNTDQIEGLLAITNQKLDALIDKTGNSANLYNKVTQYKVDDNNPTLTIAANTVHSITYGIIAGTADVNIDGTTITYITGETSHDEGTTLISSTYTFTAPAGASITVKTIS